MIFPSTLMRRVAAVLFATSSLVNLSEAATKIKGGADPAIMQVDGYYYSANTCGASSICVRKSKDLVGLGSAEESIYAWSDDDKLGDVWAPEILVHEGRSYVYFTAGRSDAHRMYVVSSDEIMGEYSEMQKVNLPDDEPAIDGLLFTFENQLWFVWSGWRVGNNDQTIYICRMKSPTQSEGKKFVVSQPREGWEGDRINEGPEVIVDPNGQLHIAYSANGSWESKYCLADLRLKKGGDPTKVWDWFKSNGCLFGSHQDRMMSGWDATKQLDGPGHHTFALPSGDVQQSPGGSNRIPFVYHAVEKGEKYSWGNRNWYAGSFVWWSKTTYRRGGSNAATDVGYSFKFFE